MPTFSNNGESLLTHFPSDVLFWHKILHFHSVQMDNLQGLNLKNGRRRLEKSDVLINLHLCATDTIGGFLRASKSSLPLRAKLSVLWLWGKLCRLICHSRRRHPGQFLPWESNPSTFTHAHRPLHPHPRCRQQLLSSSVYMHKAVMTEAASGVQASDSKLLIIFNQFCFKYLVSAAPEQGLTPTLSPSLLLADICISWMESSPCSYSLTVPGLPDTLDQPNLHPASVFFSINIRGSCILKGKEIYMVQWEHISSILLTLTESANTCFYIFFLFISEKPQTLCSYISV